MMGDMADWINEQGEISEILDPCTSCIHQEDCQNQCGRYDDGQDNSIQEEIQEVDQ